MFDLSLSLITWRSVVLGLISLSVSLSLITWRSVVLGLISLSL